MSDYPRMLYRPGQITDHSLEGVTLLIGNEFRNETLIVGSEDEELVAGEKGWKRTPYHAEGAAKPARLSKGSAA